MTAKKSLGQHFLKDGSVAKKMIDALQLQKGDVVFEIGPGHGELTLPLISVATKVGAGVFAIEKDIALATELEKKNGPPLKVFHGDALKTLSIKIAGSGAGQNCKITGNIPYYITGHLLRTIGELDPLPERVVIMIQKEVAERIVAAPPKMNRLAGSVQFWSNVKIVCAVPKEYFSPIPKVDSAVISLERKSLRQIRSVDYYRTIRAIFAQPRKTLLNNLAEVILKQEMTKEIISAGLKKIGIDPESRPQNLSIQQIEDIADIFFT